MACIILSLALGTPVEAQPVESLRLALGFGVDTTASPEREILALWKAYLTEPSDSLRARMWSSTERLDGKHFDLIAPYVYQGFEHFTVVHLGPSGGSPSYFVIRTLVSGVEDSTQDVRPLALYRVYATQENGRWVLANALSRNTREWHRTTLGKIAFVYPPTHRFNLQLGRASSAFVDSLAAAFGLPAPRPITYVFTDDLGETLRALGLEYFPYGSDPLGGRSNVYARHVYVGAPANGEGYVHELAHIVLDPVVRGTSRLLVEGLTTWTGGSAGQSYGALVPRMAQYLSNHPDMTLERLLSDPPPRVDRLDVGYVGCAALCKMVFDRRGLSALRTLLSSGKDSNSILGAAVQALGVSSAELSTLWRKECGVP
jgi:hypothetical protein